MMKQPWIKFWVTDWMGNPALRCCSLEARALWADMLCLMHCSEKPGHLIAGGNPMKAVDLARITGCTPEKALKLLRELEPMFTTVNSCIVDPKMAAAAQKSQKCSQAGQRGQKRVSNNKGDPDLDPIGSPSTKPPRSPKGSPQHSPHNLEARSVEANARGEEGAGGTSTLEASPKPKGKFKSYLDLGDENSQNDSSGSDSRPTFDPYTTRQKARNRWLMAVEKLWAPRGAKGGQHAADRTSCEQMFDERIWPEKSLKPGDCEYLLGSAMTLIDRAAKNGTNPMAWLTKRVKDVLDRWGSTVAAPTDPAGPLHPPVQDS